MTRLALVLGMHRSGTSALSSVLDAMSFHPGRHVLGARPDNPAGFQENLAVMRTHEQFLRQSGSAWHDPRPIPHALFQTSGAEKTRRDMSQILQQEYVGLKHGVVKDPRQCRLMPLWNEWFTRDWPDTKIVLMLRAPAEVARSLAKRNQITFTHALLLWLCHVTESELHSRSFPRMTLHYDRLIENPHASADVCARFLGVKAPSTQSADAIRPELRHHSGNENQEAHPLLSLARNVEQWLVSHHASQEIFHRGANAFSDIVTLLTRDLPGPHLWPGPWSLGQPKSWLHQWEKSLRILRHSLLLHASRKNRFWLPLATKPAKLLPHPILPPPGHERILVINDPDSPVALARLWQRLHEAGWPPTLRICVITKDPAITRHLSSQPVAVFPGIETPALNEYLVRARVVFFLPADVWPACGWWQGLEEALALTDNAPVASLNAASSQQGWRIPEIYHPMAESPIHRASGDTALNQPSMTAFPGSHFSKNVPGKNLPDSRFTSPVCTTATRSLVFPLAPARP